MIEEQHLFTGESEQRRRYAECKFGVYFKVLFTLTGEKRPGKEATEKGVKQQLFPMLTTVECIH